MYTGTDSKIPTDSVANGHPIKAQAKISAPETWGVAHGEYQPTADEQLILDFFALGIDSTGESIALSLQTGRLQQAARLEDRLSFLIEARDLIACGHHREDHPTREINPITEARYKLGRNVRR